MELTLNNMVLHSLQLVDTEVVRIQAEKYASLLPKEQLNFSVMVSSQVKSNREGYSYINIALVPESKNFELKVSVGGKFQSEKDLDKGALKQFLLIQGVRLLWPYAREVIRDISSKMLPKPLVLPTLDVIETLKNANMQNGDAEENGDN